MGKCLWEGTTGDGYFEGVMAVEAGALALDDVGSEGAGKSIDGREGEKVWLSCHRDGEISRNVVEVVANLVGSAIDSWMFT